MEEPKILPPPTQKQQRTLHLMIFIGFCSMCYFLFTLLNKSIIANPLLYWLLMVTLIFTCLKIIYEWYHYLFISVPEQPSYVKDYTVDIFTTFCAGEPYEMIVETLTAVQAIRYPHNTYLCDEADDQYLKEVCKNLGVHHVTRKEKKNAKAGNINNALAQSSGELCVVLDPDHVPFPEFLDPIVNHFNDPTVGYVQVVQAYYNQDESLVAKGAAQQTYQFYGPMMMTMNSYGTVQAIGANCTFRRTALESIGGHAAGLAEDMHTAMQIHAKGWKSIYVPAVLARGLVPATLSAYYKQQLKWSRGVFELLVTSYVELFSKFNWRQKIHYGILPFHYMSGIIYLLNFLIPIVSLFGDTYPLQLDLVTFTVDAFPLIISTVIIRHYVQQWVMEDKERGFHLIGGLLQIGTWWIFNLGLIYTIVRKNVPYIPTPKEATDEKNLIINIPNICVLALSIAAIIYGLYYDWNPFTFMMASIASINCVFIIIILYTGEELKIKKRRKNNEFSDSFFTAIGEAKGRFWILRRKVYKQINNRGLLIMVVGIFLCFYFHRSNLDLDFLKTKVIDTKKSYFLTGIFSPTQSDGISSLKLVDDFQTKSKTHLDIVSFYIPWGNQRKCFLPVSTLDTVYKNESVPMITWEPWQILFEDSTASNETFVDQKVFANITNGKYDDYIKRFALQIKALKQPVFLRFAHEVDNPFYPWSKKGKNSSQEFKAAWKYLRKVFFDNNVYNAIWIWNPWQSSTAAEYFPGKDNIDWIGVTGLNFAHYNHDKKARSFEEIYYSYHKNPIFRQGIPVMIAEMASLKTAGNQEKWVTNAFQKIKISFPEIKAIVLFNSSFDKNLPDGSKGTLNWSIQTVPNFAIVENPHKQHSSSKVITEADSKPIDLPKNNGFDITKTFLNTKGVNYNKAQYWYRNITPLTRKTITKDFAEMQKVGINTVKFCGPSVYDRLSFSIAKDFGMKVHYCLYIPENINFINDVEVLKELTNTIVSFVQNHKDNESILSWNISNSALQKLEKAYYKPELYYQQQAYFTWLKDLTQKIKNEDPKRPITLDVELLNGIDITTSMIKHYVPEIDAFGLVVPEKSNNLALLKTLKVPYFLSNIPAKFYLRLSNSNHLATFIESWQDQESAEAITFNGLKDVNGRNKPDLYLLSKKWHGSIASNNLPLIKILRPAMTTIPNTSLPYYALIYKNNSWQIAENNNSGLTFEWYLVKTDGTEKGVSIQKLGTGTSVNVIIPEDVLHHKLYLIASKGKNISTTQSILNLPL